MEAPGRLLSKAQMPTPASSSLPLTPLPFLLMVQKESGLIRLVLQSLEALALPTTQLPEMAFLTVYIFR